jgi:hypothetical protein
MKAVAGDFDTCNASVRVASRRGLPLVIPGAIRLLIESGDVGVTRITLTILSLYRVIKCDPVEKVNTITDPFKGLYKTLPLPEIMQVLSGLPYKDVKLRPNAKLLHSTKSGPNFNVSSLGATLDAYCFHEHYEYLQEKLEDVCKLTGPLLMTLLRKEFSNLKR